MSIQKNFVYSGILLISQYIMPLILFPYISRVFGLEKIGVVNWVDSTVNYFILISMLGLTLLGVRETARHKDDNLCLSETFVSLLLMHLVFTIIVLVVYLFLIFYVDKFYTYKELLYIGILKIVFNVFLVEWFYRGIEHFKFITVRSLIIKVIYLLLVFLLVKKESDYKLYFVLTCLVVVINAFVNIFYVKRFIKISFGNIRLVYFLKPYFTLGAYILLTSMYTSFNITYLGVASSDVAVGAYSTALKIYTIILGIFTSLNTVLIPRVSTLVNESLYPEYNQVIEKSLKFVLTFSIPIILCGVIMADSLISFLAGSGFNRAVVCFRIILPLIFFVGLAQVFSYLILIPFKSEKQLMYTSVIGAIIGIVANLLLVPRYHEIGSSLVVLLSEMVVTLLVLYFSTKVYTFKFSVFEIANHLFCAILYIPICVYSKKYFERDLDALLIAGAISGLYFIFSQIFLIRNILLLNVYKRILSRITSH